MNYIFLSLCFIFFIFLGLIVKPAIAAMHGRYSLVRCGI